MMDGEKILENIFKGIEYEILNRGKAVEFSDIEYDSRKIKSGGIFAALEGFKVDGHNFIDAAVSKGASMIIVSKDVDIKYPELSYVKVEDLRKKLGIIASNFYREPQNQMKIVGITGTNGKTTTTYILETLLGNVS